MIGLEGGALMTSNSLLLMGASLVFAIVGALFGSRGAARTQVALRKARGRDKLIDIMAWIDRKVFHAPQ